MLLKELSARSGYRLALPGTWPGAPHVGGAEYATVFTCRRLQYSRRLFLAVSPGVVFPQEADYKARPSVTLQREVVFGEE